MSSDTDNNTLVVAISSALCLAAATYFVALYSNRPKFLQTTNLATQDNDEYIEGFEELDKNNNNPHVYTDTTDSWRSWKDMRGIKQHTRKRFITGTGPSLHMPDFCENNVVAVEVLRAAVPRSSYVITTGSFMTVTWSSDASSRIATPIPGDYDALTLCDDLTRALDGLVYAYVSPRTGALVLFTMGAATEKGSFVITNAAGSLADVVGWPGAFEQSCARRLEPVRCRFDAELDACAHQCVEEGSDEGTSSTDCCSWPVNSLPWFLVGERRIDVTCGTRYVRISARELNEQKHDGDGLATIHLSGRLNFYEPRALAEDWRLFDHPVQIRGLTLDITRWHSKLREWVPYDTNGVEVAVELRIVQLRRTFAWERKVLLMTPD